MFISSHRIEGALSAKRMKLDGELSMLSVFTSISCSVPAEKNDAIFVHIISVESADEPTAKKPKFLFRRECFYLLVS